MALLDFLGDLASNLGPVGGPRRLPVPIETIDPNTALGKGPSAQFLQAFGNGIPPAQAPEPAPLAAPVAQPSAPMGGFAPVSPVAAIAEAPAAPVQQAPATPAPRKRSGFRDFLGQLGDVLLVANDMAPIYTPQMRQRQLGEAMASYLGDPGLAAIAMADPQVAAQFYDRGREDKRFDRSAGQEDRRIGIGEGDMQTRRGGLFESVRHNKATEGLTARGQDKTAQLQTDLAELRLLEGQIDREYRAAEARGDRAHAEKMLGLQTEAAAALAAVEAQIKAAAGDGGEVTTETLSGDGTSKTTTKRKLPAVGAVQGGYRFKGGDPANPASWEKVG